MNGTWFVPQGWECPKCGRVYNPSTIMCIYCPGQVHSVSSATGTDRLNYPVPENPGDPNSSLKPKYPVNPFRESDFGIAEQEEGERMAERIWQKVLEHFAGLPEHLQPKGITPNP